ncbi:hypothetical protein ALC57_16488 [Trachymyrmex cornetzi]|uniref:Chromo domain-containing protein n=1 Tax=Trachymyrmex cornetzi TaxID=471704 RepID=A0A151IUW0_9HYME|nr:hypothetical protein ALC57_16488 [Trachymyrmex cornetzi]
MREWYMTRVIEPTLASLEEFQERDSGWALSRILNLVVNVNKLNKYAHKKLFSILLIKNNGNSYNCLFFIYQRFSIRTLGEYSDLYLKTGVLLLADIFENFRNSCVASYGLDPAHYYTLPGFTWDAMIFYEQELARVEKNVEEEQLIVDRVIKSKGRGTNKQVLVSWRDYPSKFDSWIPASSLISLRDGGGTISSGTSE